MFVNFLFLNFTHSSHFHYFMDILQRFCFVALVILSAVVFHGADAKTVVSGTVFCDQCKDGHVSFFDYPLSGTKVALACSGPDKQVIVLGEESTNWVGSYYIKVDSTPDLSNCFVRVSGSIGEKRHECSFAAGPAQKLKKVFKLFGYMFYSVDTLLSQPLQPVSFCPKPNSPAPPTIRADPDLISPVAPPPLN